MDYILDNIQHSQDIAIEQLEDLIRNVRAGMVKIYQIGCAYGYNRVPDNTGKMVRSTDGSARYTIFTRRTPEAKSPDHHPDDPGRVDVIADYSLVSSHCDSNQPEQDNCPGRV